MDAAQLNQLLTGLQALTQQLQANANANQAANAGAVSPYEGGPINVNTRTGSSLYAEATKAISDDKPYNGKSEELYPLIASLKGRATKCHWGDQVITNIGPDDLNLFTDYGRIQKQTLLDVRTARDADNTDNGLRQRQNANMFYHCLWNSLSSTMKETLDVDPELTTEIQEDGPLLFFKLVTMSQQTTFIQANSMRDQLNTLHPKRFNYNVKSINDFIRRALRIMRAASDNASSPSRQEALYFIFTTYKKIKLPTEWVQTMQFYENQMATQPANIATEESLYEKAESLQQKIEKSPTGWKPSDKTAEEQVVAMIAEQKKRSASSSSSNKQADTKKGRNQSTKSNDGKDPSDKKPPFANSKGKEGDVKTWKEKKYYYCSHDHKTGHWQTHKPSECRAKQKKSGSEKSDSSSGDSGRVTVDRNKLKQSMSAIFASSGLDVDASELVTAAIDALDQE